MNMIIYISSFVTALTTIIVSAYKVISLINYYIQKLEYFEEQYNETIMNLYKLSILSEDLPLLDRIRAGEKYLEMGGNGIIKKKYEELLDKEVKIMKKDNNI